MRWWRVGGVGGGDDDSFEAHQITLLHTLAFGETLRSCFEIAPRGDVGVISIRRPAGFDQGWPSSGGVSADSSRFCLGSDLSELGQVSSDLAGRRAEFSSESGNSSGAILEQIERVSRGLGRWRIDRWICGVFRRCLRRSHQEPSLGASLCFEMLQGHRTSVYRYLN